MGKQVNRVDLMDAARAAQRTEVDPFLRPGSLRITAPAKVNLFLGIGARRADGYHDALSIMHSLALHDVLWMRRGTPAEVASGGHGLAADGGSIDPVPFQQAEGLQVSLTMRFAAGLPAVSVASEDNLAVRAVRSLAQETGHGAGEAIVMHLEKAIPAQAGLGGGSSDAAAALVGACQLWGLAKDDPAVVRAARKLGADVAFFLYGGCVALSGVGDEFHHRLEPMKSPVALIKPSEGVSTAAAYRLFDENPALVDQQRYDRAFAAKRAADVPLTNNLVPAAEELLPELAAIRQWAEAQPGVQGVLMSGSGSATFACCESLSAATALVSSARAKGWWSRATSFSSLGATLTPLRR